MPENGPPKTLEEHSIDVAKNAMDLCKCNDEATRCAAYCAGLLHDVGKLSPSYQKLFCDKLANPGLGAADLRAIESKLEHRYGRRQHAIFSCMLAWCLLYATNPHHSTSEHIARAVLCHHGRLRDGIGGLGTQDTKFRESQKETAENWQIFQAHARTRPEYPAWFDWEKANRSFVGRQSIGSYGNPRHGIAEYLRGRIVFSALVQGDYLSFSANREQAQRQTFGEWMCIDAESAHNKNIDPSSQINTLRAKFQKDAALKYDTDKLITIIDAPTGIGKTALLLDIMSRHAKKGSLARCYYFAPLIALNSSFVELVQDTNVMSEEAHKYILTYNHAFKGTLDPKEDTTDKNDDLDESDYVKYNFAYEAFQYPMVITTTQRLMLTLYANHKASAMKLVSLTKSLMIIDEIQTIPRFMRQTTMNLLNELCKECDSRVVLASATVPAELKNVYTVGMNSDEKKKYLELTSRAVDMGSVIEEEVEKVIGLSPLVMFNTRKKAAEFYGKISSLCKNVAYLSTGITRGERLASINTLVNQKKSMGRGKWPHEIVVSTQVLEAGVDASFGRIWRELAPMDSIVQTMGRLDRGAEMGGSARITIFGKYESGNTLPYDSLDVKTTYEMLKEMCGDQLGAFKSDKLYEALEKYYDLTATKNSEAQEQKEKFENYVKKCQYEKVWDMVAKTMTSYNTPIIIPHNDEDWQAIHDKLKSVPTNELTREQKMKNARMRRDTYSKHSNMVAEFPESKICKIRHMLDENLLENGIAFPKKTSVRELYERDGMGLDRHLIA